MSTSEITIKILRDGENIKTTVTNDAGDDIAMNIMSGAIKLFLADDEMLQTYANLVKTFIETGKINDGK